MPLPDALRRWAMPLLLAALLLAVAGVCVLRAAGSASQRETASQKAWALADQAHWSAGTVGIIQSLADQNKLLEAIAFANEALRQRPSSRQRARS